MASNAHSDQTAADVLKSLETSGVEFWIEGGQLRYRAPKGTLTAERIASLREHKPQIVAALAERGPPSQAPALAAATAMKPLSFQQQWLWNGLQGYLRHNVVKGLGLHCVALRLRGGADPDVLRRSLEFVVARHESLRTKIVVVDGMPMQRFDDSRFSLPVIDLARAESNVASEAQRSIARFFGRSSDLAIDRLFDALLIKLGTQEYVLAATVHCLAADAATITLLFREVWHAYQDLAAGRQSSLPEPGIQYGDYVTWQRATYSKRQQEIEAYWDGKLSGASRLELPPDSGLEQAAKFGVATLDVEIETSSSAAIRDLARNERTFPAMVVLALYTVLMWSWTGKTDFIVPFVNSGRDRPSQIEALGIFTHRLLLRMLLTGNETFAELLRLVSKEFRAAHEHLDFGKAAAARPDLCTVPWMSWISRRPEERTGIPLPARVGNEPGFSVETFGVDRGDRAGSKSAMDLGAWFCDTGEEISGQVVYREDLFALGSMQRLARSLRKMSELVTQDPCYRLASLRDVFAS